jgi:hypothetical protein
VRDPFEPTWDLHLYLGGGGHSMLSGFAMTCAILALALDRPLSANIAILSVGIYGSEHSPFQYLVFMYSLKLSDSCIVTRKLASCVLM